MRLQYQKNVYINKLDNKKDLKKKRVLSWKLIKRKAINYMLNRKATIVLLTVGLIK